ncbi:MAG: SUF system NifU family Fe-S cluster assembly protein [Lachnospiraceae bacterium]|nr:SUF system NifU family Fe-S cluster assembly protein [Lachnospiraceae bacterium]
MAVDNFYNEVLTDHNLHPSHKHDICGATCEHRGINPSCGDDIVIKLKVEDGVIKDGSYVGCGCAVSQASADMMLDLVIGKSVEEAKRYHEIFLKMIRGTITDEELDELEDAQALKDIAHMPARVKCATLSWRTLGEILKQAEE